MMKSIYTKLAESVKIGDVFQWLSDLMGNPQSDNRKNNELFNIIDDALANEATNKRNTIKNVEFFSLSNIKFICYNQQDKDKLHKVLEIYKDKVNPNLFNCESLAHYFNDELISYNIRIDDLNNFKCFLQEYDDITKNLECEFIGKAKPITPINNNKILEIKAYHDNSARNAFQKLKFYTFPIKIGKVNGNNIIFNSSLISNEHAEIKFENNTFYIIDLSSSNGTFLNGLQITPLGSEFKERDKITFGGVLNVPEIEILSTFSYNNPMAGTITPLTPSNNATPAPSQVANTTLSTQQVFNPMQSIPTAIISSVKCYITVKSFKGQEEHIIDINYPISIGRDANQTIVIPTDYNVNNNNKSNIGSKQRNSSSNQHIQITKLDEVNKIAYISEVTATNGTYVNDVKQLNKFQVGFDKDIQLGVDDPKIYISISIK